MSEPWPDELRTREVILSGDTYVIDFAPGCQVSRGGVRCGGYAVAWVEIHQVSNCRHPALDRGNLSRLVCESCLSRYERQAELASRTRWWRPGVRPVCKSCGMTIYAPSNVLQIVRSIA